MDKLTSVKLTDFNIRDKMLTRKCLRLLVDILLFCALISSMMCWIDLTLVVPRDLVSLSM